MDKDIFMFIYQLSLVVREFLCKFRIQVLLILHFFLVRNLFKIFTCFRDKMIVTFNVFFPTFNLLHQAVPIVRITYNTFFVFKRDEQTMDRL